MVGSLLRGCRCTTSWCDLDLTFEHTVVSLKYEILFRLYHGKHKGHWLGVVGVQCHGVTLIFDLAVLALTSKLL